MLHEEYSCAVGICLNEGPVTEIINEGNVLSPLWLSHRPILICLFWQIDMTITSKNKVFNSVHENFESSKITDGSTYGLKERAVLADVARRGEAQSADQPRAHVRHDVAVQVGHHLRQSRLLHVTLPIELLAGFPKTLIRTMVVLVGEHLFFK